MTQCICVSPTVATRTTIPRDEVLKDSLLARSNPTVSAARQRQSRTTHRGAGPSCKAGVGWGCVAHPLLQRQCAGVSEQHLPHHTLCPRLLSCNRNPSCQMTKVGWRLRLRSRICTLQSTTSVYGPLPARVGNLRRIVKWVPCRTAQRPQPLPC
jgi:hypothetical protein